MPFETAYSDLFQDSPGFFLLLSDLYARSDSLLGDVTVTSGKIRGRRQGDSGIFVFPELAAGQHVFEVRAGKWTPFYRDASVTVDLPVTSPLWPAYPDLFLANRDLPLDDPGQPAAYRLQRASAALLPAIAYPFDGSATLARGSVTQGDDPLPDATVTRVGGGETPYTTGADGQFVLFFPRISGMNEAVTLRASHLALGDQDVPVTLMRAASVSVRIEM